MTPEPTPLVTVTQADRDAAAGWMTAQSYDWGLCDDVRVGRVECDLPEAFARHRLAALEEAAKVADERERQLRAMAADHKERGLFATYPTIDSKADLAANLATAIRALSNKGGRDGE